jgi:hypothetical protein
VAFGFTAFDQFPKFAAERHRAAFAILCIFPSQTNHIAVDVFPTQRGNFPLAPSCQITEAGEIVEIDGQVADESVEVCIIEKALSGVASL